MNFNNYSFVEISKQNHLQRILLNVSIECYIRSHGKWWSTGRFCNRYGKKFLPFSSYFTCAYCSEIVYFQVSHPCNKIFYPPVLVMRLPRYWNTFTFSRILLMSIMFLAMNPDQSSIFPRIPKIISVDVAI